MPRAVVSEELSPSHPIDDTSEVIRQLQAGGILHIHTIPSEEWILSCSFHPTLLFYIYQLQGRVAGTPEAVSWECGLLSELLIKLICYQRRVQYSSFDLPDEDLLRPLVRGRIQRTPTLEEKIILRLQRGDIFFFATGEEWRLTSTCFGQLPYSPNFLFYLRREAAINEPPYKGTDLTDVLLPFLCQQAAFEGWSLSKIIPFPQGGKRL